MNTSDQRDSQIKKIRDDLKEFCTYKPLFEKRRNDKLKCKGPSVKDAEALYIHRKHKEAELDALAQEVEECFKDSN